MINNMRNVLMEQKNNIGQMKVKCIGNLAGY